MREHLHNHEIVPPMTRLVQYLKLLVAEPHVGEKDAVDPVVLDALSFYLMLIDKPEPNEHAEKLKHAFILSVQEANTRSMKIGPSCKYGLGCIAAATRFMEWMRKMHHPHPSWLNTMAVAVAFDTLVRNIKTTEPVLLNSTPGINEGNVSGMPFFDRNAERLKQIKLLIADVQADLLVTDNYSPDDSTFVVMMLAYADIVALSTERAIGVLSPKLKSPE